MGTLKTQDLLADFSGEIITPEEKSYEQFGTTLTAKGSPALIVRPKTAQDIAKAVLFAGSHALPVTVRSGGHGASTNTGGLVIDMFYLTKVELIDAPNHIVKIGAGATWGDVAKELQRYGLAISSGDTKTVGVGGLTLGGGIGLMARKYGLAIDNLVGATLVTAQGDIIRADANNHADLFWAVRGGGSGYGVVVDFEFAAHPLKKVYAGVIAYEPAHVDDIIKQWRDQMRLAPEALTTVLMSFPAMSRLLLVWCFALDDEAAAAKALEPFTKIGKVLQNDVTRRDYVDALQDPPMPPGQRLINSSAFVHELTDEVINTVVASNLVVQLRMLGGAVDRVDTAATAFAHRGNEALIVAPVFVAPNASETAIRQALQPWDAIAQFSTGAYGNFSDLTTEKALKDAYPPETYKRLASIKKTYDPTNVFARSQ